MLILSLGMSSYRAAGESPTPSPNPDAQFDQIARDFIGGYLAARPLFGVALGLHEFDGKIGDYSRLAIDAETERLHRFQTQLTKIDPQTLSQRADIDRRI